MEYEPSQVFMIYLFLTSKTVVSLPFFKKKNELITASQENS